MLINKEKIVLSLILLIFLLLGLYQLNSSGMDVDEAAPATLGVGLLDTVDYIFPTKYHVWLFGYRWPLNMYQGYAFTLMSYMQLPIFFIFGISFFTVKLMPILAVLLSLLFLYYLIRVFFGINVAIITISILASSMIFIHFARMGYSTTEPIINLFFWGSCLLYTSYLKNKKFLLLCLAAFLFGCGFSVKLSMAARLVGLVSAGFFIYPDKLVKIIKKQNIAKGLLLALFFFIGSIFLIAYNIQSRGDTVKLFGQLLSHQENNMEVNNSKVMQNFSTRQNHLKGFLAESNYYKIPYQHVYFKTAESPSRELQVYLYAFVFIYYLFKLIFRSSQKYRVLKFLYVFYVTMFFVSLFSPGSLDPSHLAILYPFPQLLLSLFVVEVFRFLRNSNVLILNRKIPSFLCAATFLLLPYKINIDNNITYHAMYRLTGGYGYFSAYINDVVKYLKSENIDLIYTCSTTTVYTGLIVSVGKPMFIRKFDLSDVEENLFDKMEANLKKTKEFFLLVELKLDNKDNLVHYWLLEKEQKGEILLDLRRVFKNKIGDVVYWVYKVSNVDFSEKG